MLNTVGLLTNNNSNGKCNEYEKMQLCKVALILQEKLIEIKDRDNLLIQFPIWLWYRYGGDAVTCRVIDIKMSDVESFSLEWEDNYIKLCICLREGDSEWARFDNSALLTTFVNNIRIDIDLDLPDIGSTIGEFSYRLFPLGCVSKTIYEG